MRSKAYLSVIDTRGVFSNKTGTDLLGESKRQLEVVYSFTQKIATDIDTEITKKPYGATIEGTSRSAKEILYTNTCFASTK